jgi:hypothetical protein
VENSKQEAKASKATSHVHVGLRPSVSDVCSVSIIKVDVVNYLELAEACKTGVRFS